MKVVVAYESMYGNTHHVAEAVAAGFDGTGAEVVLTPVSHVDAGALDADVLILGSPTHAHGLPSVASRRAALEQPRAGRFSLAVDRSATDSGVREWLAGLPEQLLVSVAAYDTRFKAPGWLVGHPSRHLLRVLRRHGAKVLARPESFFVDRHEQLHEGEIDRAREWGRSIAAAAGLQTAERIV